MLGKVGDRHVVGGRGEKDFKRRLEGTREVGRENLGGSRHLSQVEDLKGVKWSCADILSGMVVI